jgi:hypothetical protein
MPKTFYTEKDIEDLVRSGRLVLEVDENVVLTDLAYEKANRLGLRLEQARPENPPCAPVRPYIAQSAAAAIAGPAPTSSPIPATPLADNDDLRQRIRLAVTAKLGSQVDPQLLELIITRVLQATGTK